MKILGYHISENKIINSDGEEGSESFLRYLTVKKPSTIRVLYDVPNAITNFMRMMNWGNGQLKKLFETTRLIVTPYHFRYIPFKFFSIKKRNEFAYYCDVSKYIVSNSSDKTQVAKETGEQVYSTLLDLGVTPINILNPYKQFKKQVLELSESSVDKHLAMLKYKSESANGISKLVIDEIIQGIEEDYGVVSSDILHQNRIR